MIIGISGKIGSGKDTFANMLQLAFIEYGKLNTQTVSFAHKLKKITAIITGADLIDMFNIEGKKKICPIFGKSYGELQQIIGTDVMRDNFDNEVWIKALFAEYKPYKGDINIKSGDIPVWIITDVRFKNEADAILRRGGIIVRMEGDPAGVRAKSNRDLNHPSETDLDDYLGFLFTIHNEPEAGLERMKKIANKIISIHEK